MLQHIFPGLCLAKVCVMNDKSFQKLWSAWDKELARLTSSYQVAARLPKAELHGWAMQESLVCKRCRTERRACNSELRSTCPCLHCRGQWSCLWCLSPLMGDSQAGGQEKGLTWRHFYLSFCVKADRSAVFSALTCLFFNPSCCFPHPPPFLKHFTGRSRATNLKYATSSQTLE